MMDGRVLMKGLSLFPLILFLTLLTSAPVLSSCPCVRIDLCNLVKPEFTKGPHVYVFSRGNSNVHLWRWKAIDTLVVPSNFNKTDPLHADTMCTAHGQGKRFGITVEFKADPNNPGKLNMTHSAVEKWRMDAYLQQTGWHADLIVVDLLPYFNDDQASNKTDHINLATTLFGLKEETKSAEILCIVPWKPPCSKTDGYCHFSTFAREGCDYFLLNPDSFLDSKGSKCVAHANIPLTKLLYGISEYTAHHIPPSRIVLGVPWHGYDYTCKSQVNNVCNLQDSPTTEKTPDANYTCDYSNYRKWVSYGDILNDHNEAFLSHDFNEMYDAPFINYKVGSENHQIWFEDRQSLKDKYRLVHELGLRGVAVLYGDDLSPSSKPTVFANDDYMWSWLIHETILNESSKSEKDADFHWADTIAGVAVGCLLLGSVLGVIFTCISMQKRVRKPRAPFQGDMDPLGTDYTDDPDL